MRTHVLKSWPEFFERVLEGTKTFELRRNDRDFQVGDVLLLREWIPPAVRCKPGGAIVAGSYTGREIYARVVYSLAHADGLDLGFVILGIVVDTVTP